MTEPTGTTPKLYYKPYFDVSLFIAWIQGEVKKGVDRGAIVEHLFHLARRGTFQMYSSTLSLAEIHRLPEERQEETLLAFLEIEIFVFVELDRTVGEEARRLCRRYDLRPNQAIHLASAERAGCDVLLTWDTSLLNIKHPKVRTEPPAMIGQLSMESQLLRAPIEF